LTGEEKKGSSPEEEPPEKTGHNWRVARPTANIPLPFPKTIRLKVVTSAACNNCDNSGLPWLYFIVYLLCSYSGNLIAGTQIGRIFSFAAAFL